ncbi:hypothetical protein P9057_06720 [Gallibacterium anatis]
MVFESLPESDMVDVFTPYITIKGKRIYHPHGGVYHFKVPADKYRQR